MTCENSRPFFLPARVAKRRRTVVLSQAILVMATGSLCHGDGKAGSDAQPKMSQYFLPSNFLIVHICL